MSHLGQTTKGASAGALGMPLFLRVPMCSEMFQKKCSGGTLFQISEQMTTSLLWTILASHMYPGVVLVFWVPSRILSLPFSFYTKVNHDYQVHSQHLEQVS